MSGQSQGISRQELSVELNQEIDNKVDKVTGKSLISDSEITRLAGVTNFDSTSINAAITALNSGKLDKSTYNGTAQDLYNLIINATTGVTGISVVPTDTPTGTGVASWIAVQNGTYTNFGGKVLPVNSVGIISRSAVGGFSISYTAFDFSAFALKTDVNGIKSQYSNGEFIIIDENENIAVKLDKEGNWHFGDVFLRKLTTETLDIASLEIKEVVADKIINSLLVSDGSTITIQDSNGNIGYEFDPLDRDIVLPNGVETGIIHTTNYGQSLSVQADGALISTTTEAGVYTFFKGPVMHTYDADSTRYDSLKLAVSDGLEVPCNGMARMLKKTLNDGYSFDIVAKNKKILISAPGKGSQSVLNLSKGTTHYARFIETVTNGKRLANLEGKTYSHPLVYYKQGEDDWLTSKTDFKKRLVQLRNDLDTDIKAIEPKNKDLFFILYQLSTSSINGLSRTHIGLALSELCSENKYFFAGPPMYSLVHSDTVHLTALSSLISGAYAGHISAKILNGHDWKGTTVKDYQFFNNTIVLDYNAEILPLVFDTVNVIDPSNYGYNLFDATGVAKTITSVILDNSQVFITATTPIVAGDILRYAYLNGDVTKAGPTQGQRGCLRDSQGETIKYTFNGQNIRLDNWAHAFEIKIK